MTESQYTALVAATIAAALKNGLEPSSSYSVALEGGTNHDDPMTAVVTHASVSNYRWRVTITEEKI